MIGYCVKCKVKREMTEMRNFVPEKRVYKTKHGIKYGIIGRCIVCSIRMAKIVKKEDYDGINGVIV